MRANGKERKWPRDKFRIEENKAIISFSSHRSDEQFGYRPAVAINLVHWNVWRLFGQWAVGDISHSYPTERVTISVLVLFRETIAQVEVVVFDFWVIWLFHHEQFRTQQQLCRSREWGDFRDNCLHGSANSTGPKKAAKIESICESLDDETTLNADPYFPPLCSNDIYVLMI